MAKPQRITEAFFLFLLLLQISPSGTAITVSAQSTAKPVANSEEHLDGIELYHEKKFAEAAKVLRASLKKNQADEEAWYYLGLTLLHQPKQIKEASKAFESALKLRPNFAVAHTGLSYSLLLRNKTSDALREARTALSIEPNIPDAHYVIGVVHLRAGAHDEALEEANTAIRLSPQFPSGYLLKSQALVRFFGDVLVERENETDEARTTRFTEAVDALEKYLELEPNAKDKQSWAEQLDSLRFYSHRTSKGIEGVFSGKQVTTKARVLKKPEPAYTEEARRTQVTGTVVLRAVFTADGTVKHFLVLQGLPYGLTEAAISAARKIKFTPARVDGRSVSMFIQLEYNFNLY
jgi:TonB family protein